MKRLIVVAGLMGFGVVAAFAQGNVIEERQNLMKQNSADVRATTPMIRGQAPFDLVKVQAVLKDFSDHGKRLPALFPPGSDKGDTKALPVLFEKKAELVTIHPEADHLSIGSARHGSPAAYHPGALRFYSQNDVAK